MTGKWSYRAEGRSKIVSDFSLVRGNGLLELGWEVAYSGILFETGIRSRCKMQDK